MNAGELARHAGGENEAQLAYNPVASCGRRLEIMKRHWVLAVGLSLAGVGAPPVSTAAGDEATSGGDEIRSSYEQAERRVEAADYEDALEILKALNRSEPGNAYVLNMVSYSHRKLGRVDAAFGYYGKRSPSSLGTSGPTSTSASSTWKPASSRARRSASARFGR